MTDDASARRTLDEIFQSEWPRLVGYVTRIVRELDAAEEIVQDAMVAALRRWPFDGVPERPAAWLTTTCRNRAINHLRDTTRRRDREGPGVDQLSVSDVIGEHTGPLEDDRLRLIFLCCHPELPRGAQVALTLRLVAGLATPDIARAFLVSETTMSQRISRAKRAVVEQRLSFEVPQASDLHERLAAVLDVVYLIFNEGYLPRAGDSLQRVELCTEAHRLAVLLTDLLPDQSEAWALLALIALQRSRTAARVAGGGELVTLENQDRTRWDTGLIATGREALARAEAAGSGGPLLTQALIAACHSEAGCWGDTDWGRIVALYDDLYTGTPSPVVALNRAVAVGMVSGPGAALALLDGLGETGGLEEHHLYWATRADFMRRAGDSGAAIGAYQHALRLAANQVERAYLQSRINQLQPGDAGPTNARGDSHGAR